MSHNTEINVNKIGDGDFSDSYMHVPALDTDFLSLCSADPDNLCYCMLHNTHISCYAMDVQLMKHRFNFPTTYVDNEIKDPRIYQLLYISNHIQSIFYIKS